MKRLALLLALLLAASVFFASCKENDNGDDNTEHKNQETSMDFSALDLSQYIILGEYKGLEISYTADQSKGDAVWDIIVKNATVKEYPEQQVSYYFSQAKAKYEYLAEKGNDTYENILVGLGITEEMLLEDAKALVKDDLVFYAVMKAENISLSEADKQNNFEKYLKKFVEDYGYIEEYARENMSEQIYQAMLFDKTLERLIMINNFVAVDAAEGK